MQPEITTRIRRDTLMELLETEAPMEDQRITARMPVVTLTDLLGDREEHQPSPRLYVRAVGTNHALKRLEPTLKAALIDPFEMVPLNEREIETVLAPLDELRDTPVQLKLLAMPLTRGLLIALSASATLLLAHLARLL